MEPARFSNNTLIPLLAVASMSLTASDNSRSSRVNQPHSNGSVDNAALLYYNMDDSFNRVQAVTEVALRDLEDTVAETQTAGEPLDLYSLDSSKRFLRSLPHDCPTPEFAIDPDGEVNFAWFGTNNNEFSLSFASDGRISFAGYFAGQPVNGWEDCIDEYGYYTIPPAIRNYICRV